MTTCTKAAQFPGDGLWHKDWVPSFGEDTIRARMAATYPSFLLYSSWFCPFAQRAWIVAEETGVNYKWVEINPYEVEPKNPGGYTKKSLTMEDKGKLHPGFLEASPRGLIPAIRQQAQKPQQEPSDIFVWESLPVAEYVDAVFGSGKLAGESSYERAMIQIWSTHCTDRIQRQYYKALMSNDNVASKKEAIQQFYCECRALANAMGDDGPYFLGKRFSLVDVALAPFWQRMIWVGSHYFDLTFPEEPEFDRLHKWWKACEQRESIKNTLVCKDRLISSYNDYARNVATSDLAKSMN